MENREIPNEAVNASSVWAPEHEPWQARLNNIKTSGSSDSWSSGSNAIGQYLQIDLGKERVVNKIATQGRPSFDQWVTSYKLLFSSDGANWNEYQNNGVVKVNAVIVTRSLAAWVTILNSKTWSMSTGGNHFCFLLRHEELTRHWFNMLRGVGWGDCSLCRWQSWDVHSLLKTLACEVVNTLVGEVGLFPSRLILLIIILNSINRGDRCRKGMVPSLTSEVAAGENKNYKIISFSATKADWRACYDQARITYARRSGVGWLFPVQMKVMRYLFAAKSLGGEISIPLVGDLGVFPSWLIPLIITFNFITMGIGVGKELCSPLPLK